MKIALIKPPQITNEIQPPLGLGYLASSVKDMAEIDIIDSIKNKSNIEYLIKKISESKYDIIGLQCYTVDFNTVKEIIKRGRIISENSIFVVGGPHPTLDPENSLKCLNADYVFIGDAEISFAKFVEFVKNKESQSQQAAGYSLSLKLGNNCRSKLRGITTPSLSNKKLSLKNVKKIPGIGYMKKGKFFINKTIYPHNLDDYNPSWELYGLKDYPIAPHGTFYKQSPIVPIIITRGCPFNCTYCGGSKISGLRIRSHSVEYVLNQIELLANEYGVKEIHIEDDNFTLNRKFVVELCKGLIKKRLGISWTCPNGIRIDTLDLELLNLMKKSGLYSVSVGIESGSDRIRNLMRKRLSTKTIEEKMKIINASGIDTIGFFILGYPGETIADINSTIDFACKLGLKRATFSAFKPFPGTDIYDELVKKGEIGALDYNNFSLDKIVWAPKGISFKRLKNLRRKAFLKFYLRPKILMKMMLEIKSIDNLKLVILRVYRWLIK